MKLSCPTRRGEVGTRSSGGAGGREDGTAEESKRYLGLNFCEGIGSKRLASSAR